jgi:uncharacterized protein YkwD
MFGGLNWIDWTIFAALVYYGFQGWQAGFAELGLTFVTFLTSLWLAIKFHAPVGDFIAQKFGVPALWTTVLGYVIVGFIAEAVLAQLTVFLIGKIPKKLLESVFNKWFGILISVFNGIVLVSFILLVILALPLRGTVKTDVKNSKLGNYLVTIAEKYGAPIESTLEQVKNTALTFITVEPDSKETITLDVAVTAKDVRVDDVLERAMLELVNAERSKAGVQPFTVDVRIIPVVRAYSKDMFLRRYFSHISPEGLSPADRLEKAGIHFLAAGENIAYAPDLSAAHIGLMNSPGHRRNILDPAFRHIGIGIIATDNYGIMVTQNFIN